MGDTHLQNLLRDLDAHPEDDALALHVIRTLHRSHRTLHAATLLEQRLLDPMRWEELEPEPVIRRRLHPWSGAEVLFMSSAQELLQQRRPGRLCAGPHAVISQACQLLAANPSQLPKRLSPSLVSSHYQALSPSAHDLHPTTLSLLDPALCHAWTLLPLSREGRMLRVATCHPLTLVHFSDLERLTGFDLHIHIADRALLEQLLDIAYPNPRQPLRLRHDLGPPLDT